MSSSLEQAIRGMLIGDATVNTLIGGKVRPFANAELDARPFLTYEILDGDKNVHATGRGAFQTNVVRIGIFGDTKSDVVALAVEVRRVLDGVGVSINNVKIAPSMFDTETDTETAEPQPGTERPVYVRVQDYRVQWKSLN